MRRTRATTAAVVLLVMFCCCGCGKRTRDQQETVVSQVPEERPGEGRDFDELTGASGVSLIGRDLPLGEHQPDMGSYFDPGGTTSVALDGDTAETPMSMRYAGTDLSVLFCDVLFGFDRYDLNQESRGVLTDAGTFLIKHPEVRVVVEGHCDERGSSSYNLTLGEKRALAVREFLAAMGVPATNVHTVSFGEEMPIDSRPNEEGWARNRRAHFRVRLP